MVIDATDRIEILKGRVAKGNDYCNELWQQIRALPDDDAKSIRESWVKLDAYVTKLKDLSWELAKEGFRDCVFGECKWDDEKYFCFGCTKRG